MSRRSEIEAKLRGYPLLEEMVERHISSLHGLASIPPGWSGIDYTGGVDYSQDTPRRKPIPPQGDNLMSSGIEDYVVESMPSPAMLQRIREYDRITAILLRLHAHERDLIEAKYFRGLSDMKSALWLDCTKRTVTNRKNRLIERLDRLGL